MSNSLVLNDFVRLYYKECPVKGIVTRKQEENFLLKTKKIKKGSQLVVHGWRKKEKIFSKLNENKYFAIPTSYDGKFQVLGRFFCGLDKLYKSEVNSWVRVEWVGEGEDSPLNVGDLIKIDKSESFSSSNDEFSTIKVITNQQKVYKLHSQAKIVFYEIDDVSQKDKTISWLQEVKKRQVLIKELWTRVKPSALYVQLVEGSSHARSLDKSSVEADLPLLTPLLLIDSVYDQCALVSLDSYKNEIFHLNLRTLLHLKLKKKYKQNPNYNENFFKFSKLDNLVESISAEVFDSEWAGKKYIELFKFWNPNSPSQSFSLQNKTEIFLAESSISSSSSKKKAPPPPSQPLQSSINASINSFLDSAGNKSQSNAIKNHTKKTSINLENQKQEVGKSRNNSKEGNIEKGNERIFEEGPGFSENFHLTINGKLDNQERNHLRDDDSIGTATSLVSCGYKIIFLYFDKKKILFIETLEIPIDGNLFNFSENQFFEFLKCLKMSESTLRKCREVRMDGRLFACLSDKEIRDLKMDHPVIEHFKQNTKVIL